MGIGNLNGENDVERVPWDDSNQRSGVSLVGGLIAGDGACRASREGGGSFRPPACSGNGDEGGDCALFPSRVRELRPDECSAGAALHPEARGNELAPDGRVHPREGRDRRHFAAVPPAGDIRPRPQRFRRSTHAFFLLSRLLPRPRP